MTDQNSQMVPRPEIVIPPKPRPTQELEREAKNAIEYLTKFASNPRLDPELRMAFNDIKNTVKMMKNTLVRMTEEAQANHDKIVEIVRSQRIL